MDVAKKDSLDPSAPMTDYEKYLFEKFFSDPSQLPQKFKAWLADYVANNGDFHIDSIPSLRGEEWIEVPPSGAYGFSNAWTNYDSNNQSAAFCKDVLGIVHLKGLIKNGTQGAIAFQLPAGYRPPLAIHFAALSNNTLGRVRVLTTGDVYINEGPIGSNAWVSLDGITFRAA